MKNTNARRETVHSTPEIDQLVTSDQRRVIDEDFDDLIEVDPYNGDPPSRRSDKDLGRMLAILDELERGNA